MIANLFVSLILVAAVVLYMKVVPCYYLKKDNFTAINAKCVSYSKQTEEENISLGKKTLERSSDYYYSTYEDEAGNTYDVKDLIRPKTLEDTTIYMDNTTGKVYPNYIVKSAVLVILATAVILVLLWI